MLKQKKAKTLSFPFEVSGKDRLLGIQSVIILTPVSYLV